MEPSRTGCRFWMVQKSMTDGAEKGTIRCRTNTATYWDMSRICTMLCGCVITVSAEIGVQFGEVSHASPEVVCFKLNSNKVLNLGWNSRLPVQVQRSPLNLLISRTETRFARQVLKVQTSFLFLKYKNNVMKCITQLQNFITTSRIFRGSQVDFAVGRL